jgi:hypothetical protein
MPTDKIHHYLPIKSSHLAKIWLDFSPINKALPSTLFLYQAPK